MAVDPPKLDLPGGDDFSDVTGIFNDAAAGKLFVGIVVMFIDFDILSRHGTWEHNFYGRIYTTGRYERFRGE